MRRFRSTLQALLTVRQRQERLAMERYSGALQARQRAVDALSTVDRESAAAAAAMRGRLAGGMPASELLHDQNHYRSVEARRAMAQQAVANADKAIAPALQGMLNARRQREVVEECMDRQRERHVRDQATQERKLLDELALRRGTPARALLGND